VLVYVITVDRVPVRVVDVVLVLVVADCLVTAARSMHMLVREVLDVNVRRLEERLVDVVAVRVMDVPLVQVVRVVPMGDRGVTALGPVDMRVSVVGDVIGHGCHFDCPS
jgi:hypothetical protein